MFCSVLVVHFLVERLASNFQARLLGSPLAGSLAGSFVGSLAGSFVGSLAGSFVGSLAGSFVGSLAGSFVGSLAGSLIGSLAGSLADPLRLSLRVNLLGRIGRILFVLGVCSSNYKSHEQTENSEIAGTQHGVNLLNFDGSR